ncbi:MAG: 3-deoxy-manno-octulosonate cytidylyltransferase [Desulfosarcinaceae bacterium]|nr:3-deoxy-manno-octulosonate cytidylyltransferase [Desulfosarcinaceae bacterium]
MTATPTCIGVIPARFASSRFPGKPLADILGKPMFWHVYSRACRCGSLAKVVLATDDERIRRAAESLNVPVVMTRSDHPSGTDRVLEAARLLGLADAPETVVVNIQGDEPALAPEMLAELVAPFGDPAVMTTTLAHAITPAECERTDQVKVVRSISGRALYFSRAAVPFRQAATTTPPYLGHIGIYAFRFHRLVQFAGLGPSPLEAAEKLEQLRLLENDMAIHVVVTRHRSIGVDRPEDLQRVRHLLEPRTDPS